MKYLYRQRGSASVFVLVSCLVLFVVLALVGDVARLYAVKVSARHALNLALRAASSQLDVDALADPENPRLVIKETDAEAAFYQILRANLRLDSSNAPLAGSIADGPVDVCFFQVVNDPPYSYSFGGHQETVDRVGVTGIIRVPVKLSTFARAAAEVPEHVDLYVHSTVVPEVVPREEG
ncbi:MAG: pilus assembly protein TadG-related protein [Desulfotomaculales bacterium]